MYTLLLALFALPAQHRIADLPQIQQGKAPFCAAAASLMGTARHTRPPALLPFVHTLPVTATGMPWLEIADALAPLGVEALIIRTTPKELRRTLVSNTPVVLAYPEGGRRHAVLAYGYDATGYHIRNPALPGPTHWTKKQLRMRWSGRQAVVLVSKKNPPDLPLDLWRAQDQRYRALEWALRAEKLGQPSPDMLTLYTKAVDAAPTIAPIRYNRAKLIATLGDPTRACDELAKVIKLDPRWPRPKADAERLGCASR